MKTLVYQYGLRAPTAGAVLVDQQLSLAHRYYNKLIEIERGRREAVHDAQMCVADLEAAEQAVLDCEGALATAESALKATRATARRRAETQDQIADVKAARQRLRDARAARKTCKEQHRTNPDLLLAYKAINEATLATTKRARAECGCYWGTYLMVERAVDAARKSITPPTFRRWTGDGLLAVQLQKGLDVDSALGCADTRLQLTVPAKAGRRRGKTKHGILRMRVSSESGAPVWAEWPMIYHRDLPAQAKIQWATVTRRRIAGKDRWRVQITIQMPEDWQQKPEVEGGHVAVEMSWRLRGNTLRVGYYLDHEGEGEELLLDSSIPPGLRQVEDLRAIRDMRMDDMRKELRDKLRGIALPEWFVERTKTMHAWRAAGRFAALAIMWRVQRFDGDVDAFELLEGWRKKDKHLWSFEANLRDKVLARRRDQYRVLAADLAGRYHTLILPRFDLRTFATHAANVEDPDLAVTAQRYQQRVAAPSELRSALVAAFVGRGGRIVEIDYKDKKGDIHRKTRACHNCGSVEHWDAGAELEHTCSACGAHWDQDRNACWNLLARFERSDGEEVDEVKRQAKWAKLGRHKGTARKASGKRAE